jgi:hypothetical protein
MKKAMKPAATKKKMSASGKDGGIQAKADAAQKKVQRRADYKSYSYNQTPAQKKASSGVRSDLSGIGGVGNSVLPSGKSGFVGKYSGLIGRTAKRGDDQYRRSTKASNKKKMAAYTNKVKIAKGKK